ncbi:MAG: caspase family protein, partial [Nocardioidaceae bacterium]
TLFAGAHMGDQLVYFESSHGYQYPEGDTMVEVLCLYDAFLTDQEFSSRTQTLPADVLTVVLDSCHSGGMNKVFFPGGAVQVARAKVWQPSAEQAARNNQLYTQVSRFKFFGRTATSDVSAVAKNFVPGGRTGVPEQKDLAQGAVDMNGALLAACMADQTAAAGSPQTDSLSAFTFGLVREVDPALSLGQLCDRVVDRLKAINMSQTPQALVPAMHPELYNETFIAMSQPGVVANGGSAAPIADGGFDVAGWLSSLLSP